MAKKASKKTLQEGVTPVLLDIKPDTPSYYVNYVGVSHTAYDFTLSVARIPSPLQPQQLASLKSGSPLTLESSLQIIIPPLLIDGLIRALSDQKQKHAETLLKQVKNNELQQQHNKLSRSVENAIYSHIRAIRALGRNEINTAEIADSLSLPVDLVNKAIASLGKKGVRIIGG